MQTNHADFPTLLCSTLYNDKKKFRHVVKEKL